MHKQDEYKGIDHAEVARLGKRLKAASAHAVDLDFSHFHTTGLIEEGKHVIPGFTVLYTGNADDVANRGVQIAQERGRKFLRLAPETTQTPEGAAPLVVSDKKYHPKELSWDYKTKRQLRPHMHNDYEVGWGAFNMQSDAHGKPDPSRFYYWILRTNGWEIGKVNTNDPHTDGGQIYLADGPGSFPVGKEYKVEMKLKTDRHGAVHMELYSGGKLLGKAVDKHSPYHGGHAGFYAESAEAHYYGFHVHEEAHHHAHRHHHTLPKKPAKPHSL